MNNQIRRQHIANDVNIAKLITVNELAVRYAVSLETIRRDLAWLERMGRLVRTHGGARTLQQEDVGELFKKRRTEHTKAKQIMAEKALTLIERYMTIGLDASSTDWFLAKIIPDMPLTVVTNSLEIVKELSTRPSIQVICTGGSYCTRYSDFIDDIAQRTLRSLHIHLTFVSCFGVNIYTGLWENSEQNAMTKRTMIDVSQHTILLADKSKFGRRSAYNMADWSQVKYVIDDEQMSPEIQARFEQIGVIVI